MVYVYFTLNGVLGEYAKTARTEATTGFVSVINLQSNLNVIVRSFRDKRADKDNCKALWTALTNQFNSAWKAMPEKERQCDKMKELKSWLDEIGKEIAYPNHVKNIYNANNNNSVMLMRKLFTDDVNSDKFVQDFCEWYVYQNSLIGDAESKKALRDFGKFSEEEIRERAIKIVDKFREDFGEKDTIYKKYTFYKESEIKNIVD